MTDILLGLLMAFCGLIGLVVCVAAGALLLAVCLGVARWIMELVTGKGGGNGR